jgi:plasmid stabilization system protein ParE
MPRLIITEGAALGLEGCRAFLQDKNAQAAKRAGQTIAASLALLETTPQMGRPFDIDAALRELSIAFGDSGYVALYRFDPNADAVYVLAFRHQREAGYH